jgi:hypothetical protein
MKCTQALETKKYTKRESRVSSEIRSTSDFTQAMRIFTENSGDLLEQTF